VANATRSVQIGYDAVGNTIITGVGNVEAPPKSPSGDGRGQGEW
jgi:hypothetical protein